MQKVDSELLEIKQGYGRNTRLKMLLLKKAIKKALINNSEKISISD